MSDIDPGVLEQLAADVTAEDLRAVIDHLSEIKPGGHFTEERFAH